LKKADVNINIILLHRFCIKNRCSTYILNYIRRDLFCSRYLLLRVTSLVLHLSLFFSIGLKIVTTLFFLSIATLPRYVSSKLCCSIEYLGLFRELVVNPMTFFGLCCKDWGTRGDLRYISCRGHWCSQALILIEVSRDHFAGLWMLNVYCKTRVA